MKNIMGCKLVEIEEGLKPSDWMTDHYEEVTKSALGMHIHPDVVGDVINDVYISFRKMEDNGEYFDMFGGENGRLIMVKEFVYSRIKRYSKNKRYYQNGDAKVVCASASGDEDSLSGEQLAMIVASEEDNSIEEVISAIDVAEELNYIVAFEKDFGVSIKAILRSLEDLAAVDNIKASLFGTLKDADNEFKEAFRHVVTYMLNNKEEAKSLLQAM